MIRKGLSVILAFLIAMSCFAGCNQNIGKSSNDIDNKMLYSDTLSIETASRTSNGRLVETEIGYYCCTSDQLLYADKSDLSKWVLVCNDPKCKHMLATCPAKVFGGIAIENGRILSLRNTEDFALEGMSGYGVYSMAPDGTDLQLEYFVEESRGVNEGSYIGAFADGQGSFYCGMSIMQTDGTYLNRVVKATADSSIVLAETVKKDMSTYVAQRANAMRGDIALRTDIYVPTEEANQHLYRISSDKLEDISRALQSDSLCGSLSGDDLYHHIPGKGYYHTQISTGKSQKMMDTQLKDGIGYHFMGNFVVEHNMTYDHIPDEPQMMIYNGEQWIEVEIPADFEHTGESVLFPLALTTEHIFFQSRKAGENCLYVINHADSNPILTLCG